MRSSISAVLVTIVAMFLAGCQQPQQQEVPNEKQARLLAAQSADLQKALAAKDAEIAALRQKHAQDVQQRDAELAKCKARIEALQKDVAKGIAERVDRVTTPVIDENAKLRKEIEQLKGEIQELKKQAEPKN
jgi:hypothetical protein